MDQTYVYLTDRQDGNGDLHTVGFYDPKGKWVPESDHEDKEEAAKRVAFLNGSH